MSDKQQKDHHHHDQKFQELQEKRRSLPIYQHREEFLNAVDQYPLLIVIGETGSGKTTQIAQFLLESEKYTKDDKIIGVTQPRRVGAVSVSRRVAEEKGVELGDLIGYQVRFNDKTSSKTKVKYMTDGVLLRECLVDPELQKYSILVLDEAHERSINTDILFGLMKQAIKKRPDLRVLITSATLEDEKFSRFFDMCPIYYVPGRSFSVEIFYLDKRPQPNYVDLAVDMIMEIHQKESKGDILVFLTGQAEIEEACQRIRKRYRTMKEEDPDLPAILPLPLYAALPPNEQIRVFEPAPKYTRKVVISTNIAETSVTVDGIVYVVDAGYVKQKTFNARTGMEQLQVVQISQVAAAQRAGRAGRTGPGKCYRLYTKKMFEQFLEVTVPEIQRSNLSNIVLTLKAMGIDDVLNFDFLDRPESALLVDALRYLYLLSALDEDGKITEIGKQMSAFPLEPSYSRILIESVKYECSHETSIVIAMMSVENLFHRPHHRDQAAQEEAEKRQDELYRENDSKVPGNLTADQFHLLALYEEWKSLTGSRAKQQDWCQDHFIQSRSMNEIEEIHSQILDIMKQQQIELISAEKRSDRHARIAKSLCAGLFLNTAKKVVSSKFSTTSKQSSQTHADASYLVVRSGQLSFVHPLSGIRVTRKPLPQYVIFTELVATSKVYLRLLCSIEHEWVEPLLNKRATVDINRVCGGVDVKKMLGISLDDADQSNTTTSTTTTTTTAPEEESELQAKFQRRNTDDNVSSARERFLQRQKEQQAQKKKK